MSDEKQTIEPQRRRAPLVSVIIATYNCADVLPACLDSIVRQHFRDYEILIADGASRDGTVQIIRSNASAIAYWESGPDRGVYDAWNKALPHASGEWICFLGADDRFHDATVLERTAIALERGTPRYRFVYGCLNIVDSSGTVREIVERPWPAVKDAFLAGTLMLPHPGSFHHRSLFEQHGHYDASFRIAGDYDFLLRELRSADALYLPNIVVANMGDGGMSSSPGNMVLGLSEIARARKKNGLKAISAGLLRRKLLARVGDLIFKLFGRRAFNSLADAYRLLGRRPAKWSR